MSDLSLVNQLEAYLKENSGEWHSKTALIERVWVSDENTRFSPETAARKLREAEQASRIAVRYDEQGHAEYRYIEPKHRERYIPINDRPAGKEDLMWRTPGVAAETDPEMKKPVETGEEPPKPKQYAIRWEGRVHLLRGEEARDAFLKKHPKAMVL